VIRTPGLPAPAPTQGPSAVVFAYSDVGVRCLRVLLDAGVRVPLVITHRDDPNETRWFGSVAELAADHGLTCVAPDEPNSPEFLESASKVAGRPTLLFSFYYRRMLSRPWLALPASGAFNMHGSLLPKYRGRAPVNWAVIHGERETGATLHVMNERPDNGAIVDQCAVPILGDDTARDVFNKVVVAAELVLARCLPRLIDGTAELTPQDLSRASYFGARRPEDGRIPIDANVLQIHDLVRALAPPFPRAFLTKDARRVFIERTRHAAPPSGAPNGQLRLWSDGSVLWLMSADGGALQVLAARMEGEPTLLDPAGFQRRFEGGCLHADA
jgi:methionyl-tRNA formyltransferase